MKEILELLAECDEIEQRTARFHLDQQIHVAVGTVLSSSSGTKYTDVASAVSCRDSKNVLTLALKVHASSDLLGCVCIEAG